jgi:tagatose-1,6-bisphosphate aldolase
MMGFLSALFSGTALYVLAWVLGSAGIGSERFPDDVSIRVKSTTSGRIHGRGGLRGGK